jgi:hypothetical protein
MSNQLKNSPKVLGLDISTKTIGWALFDIQQKNLLELTHFTPLLKPEPENKIEALIHKTLLFEQKLVGYKNLGITKVVIEEPLLNSNNTYTVGTLLRYNSMITKSIFDILGLVPEYISTYDSRKFAFPELVRENDKGKKVLFLSTPKGKNWFYDIYQIGLSNDYTNYKSYKGSSYDTPFISHAEIEDAKKTLPENVFRQEYLAEFLEGGGEVFSNIDKNTYDQWPTKYDKVYCGIDLGKQEDYTVAIFMDKEGNVIATYRNNKVSWNTLVDELVICINRYNATTLIEVNSIGDVIYEQLKKKVKSIEPFVTTNKSKIEIIEGLILDFNESNIKIPSRKLDSALYDELGYFTYEYNPKSRSIKYGHPNGLHDDCVISLALANYCRKTQVSKGTYNYYTPYI